MEKKTKLTISGIAKKSIKNIEKAKTQGKNSVVIERQQNKFIGKSGLTRSGFIKPKTGSSYKGNTNKSTFPSKSPPPASDFERRKLAEQRATKRLKEENESKNKKSSKSVLKTRAKPIGINLEVGDTSNIKTDKYFGCIIQYPGKHGKIISKEQKILYITFSRIYKILI